MNPPPPSPDHVILTLERAWALNKISADCKISKMLAKEGKDNVIWCTIWRRKLKLYFHSIETFNPWKLAPPNPPGNLVTYFCGMVNQKCISAKGIYFPVQNMDRWKEKVQDYWGICQFRPPLHTDKREIILSNLGGEGRCLPLTNKVRTRVV